MSPLGGTPLSFVLRSGPREVIFKKAPLHAIIQNLVNQEVSGPEAAIALVEGHLGHKITAPICDSKLRCYRLAVQLQEEEAQVFEFFGLPCDLVVEVPGAFIAGDGSALLTFPAASLQLIKALQPFWVCRGYSVQSDIAKLRKLPFGS